MPFMLPEPSMSGNFIPATAAPVSGWHMTSCDEVHGQVAILCKPSSYQCAFVVPFLMTPVVVSTSKRIDSWSVMAPARPARNTQDRHLTLASAPCAADLIPPREPEMTRRVDRGAFSGSKCLIVSAFSRHSWIIQSPPATALAYDAQPSPPSSLRCLTNRPLVLSHGDTGTPRSSPTVRNDHLSSNL